MDKLEWVKEEAKSILKENMLSEKQLLATTGEDQIKEIVSSHVEGIVKRLLRSQKIVLSKDSLKSLYDKIVNELFGLGSLESLLEDPLITDIMINNFSQVFIEKKGKLTRMDISFETSAEMMSLLEKMMRGTSRRINQTSPFVDFRLKDGSRVTAMIPPVSKGPALCVRKFSHEIFTLKDLVSLGSLTEEVLSFLDVCIKSKINMLVTGSTGAGKTTFLNALMMLVPYSERMVIIEDTEEIFLPNSYHHLNLLTRPHNIEGKGEITIQDLVKLSLHVRPDRIIIGEVRGEEAFYFLQAINTGHEGSMGTMHANDAEDALARIETLGLMAKSNIQPQVVKRFIGMGIGLIVHLNRDFRGERIVSQISEVSYKDNDYSIQNIFVRTSKNKKTNELEDLVFTGKIPSFSDRLIQRAGWSPQSLK